MPLLFNSFKELRKRGYAVSPHNLKPRHVQILCDWMISDTQYDGSSKRVASPATIQTYLMHLRAFARWIGKDGMIGPASEYIADKAQYERSYAAVTEKTWTAKGIDIAQKVSEVKMDNYYVWAQLLLVKAFGLRLKEAVSIRPHMNRDFPLVPNFQWKPLEQHIDLHASIQFSVSPEYASNRR